MMPHFVVIGARVLGASCLAAVLWAFAWALMAAIDERRGQAARHQWREHDWRTSVRRDPRQARRGGRRAPTGGRAA